MSAGDPVSPAELAADMIERYGSVVGQTIPDSDPPTTVTLVVGPANDAKQQAGVISLMAAGLPIVEKYTPIQWHRAQIRCLAGDLASADWLAQSVQRDIHAFVRRLCYQASNDSWYLVHLTNITAGPSMHYDSPETWETLLFAELQIGDVAVATGPDLPDV